MNTMVSSAKKHVEFAVRLECNAADIRLGIDRQNGVVQIGGPKLHLRVVRSGGQYARINLAEVHSPTPLLMLLVRLEQGTDLAVPQGDNAVVVTAR